MSNKPVLSFHIQAKKKRSTFPSVFSSYFKIINHVHDFLNTLLKEPDGFPKYVTF